MTRVERLIYAHFDGVISDAEAAELARFLKDDFTVMWTFAVTAVVHGYLADHFAPPIGHKNMPTPQ